MFEIIKTIHHDGETRRRPIDTYPTFEAAKEAVEKMGVSFMEDDADYPGCADAFMSDGSVIAIQPVGFTLKQDAEVEAAKRMAKERREAMESFDAEYGIGSAWNEQQAYHDQLHDRAVDAAFEDIGD